MIRLEHVGFRTAVQEPPALGHTTGKAKLEIWDRGDLSGGDGNELFRTAIYETEEGIVLVNKDSGIRHVAPKTNVAWSREFGECDRAKKEKDEEKAEKAAAAAEKAAAAPVEPPPAAPAAPAATPAQQAATKPETPQAKSKVTVTRGAPDTDD